MVLTSIDDASIGGDFKDIEVGPLVSSVIRIRGVPVLADVDDFALRVHIFVNPYVALIKLKLQILCFA
jgi:hypothetical protein